MILIIEPELTKEEKYDALMHYINGGEVGMYVHLLHHGPLDVLVTSRMGYYNTLGRFVKIREGGYTSMLKTLIDTINYLPLSGSVVINADDFLDNFTLPIKIDTLPYLNNKHFENSFDLIHLGDTVYADVTTKEFVRVTDGRRQSIFGGVFKSTGRDYSVLDWLIVTGTKSIIFDGELLPIKDMIKKIYGRVYPYKHDGLDLVLGNGDIITLTNRGTLNIKGKKWITLLRR